MKTKLNHTKFEKQCNIIMTINKYIENCHTKFDLHQGHVNISCNWTE